MFKKLIVFSLFLDARKIRNLSGAAKFTAKEE